MMQGFFLFILPCVVCCCSTMSVYLYFSGEEDFSFPSAFFFMLFAFFLSSLYNFSGGGVREWKLMINLSYFTREIFQHQFFFVYLFVVVVYVCV